MASACEFPEELVSKPLGYVGLVGLDTQYNAMHCSIWDTFTVNRRQEKVLNTKLLPGDAEFPKRKQKQRASYEFYLPKGIFKVNWMKKHLYDLPALVVVFYDLDWSDPQWKEKQTECASRVAVIRSSLFGRNTRIAVVLIQKNMPLPRGEDPQALQRAESLCQACELPSKSLFVLPFSDHLHGYVTRLEGAFYEIAQTYYANESKYVKQHRELLNKSQHQLLFVRHQFKIAFYNELKQDPQVALKHYKQSYQYLLEQRLTDINNLEVKLCAGFLNYKICKISFQLTAPLDAISQFRKHIDYFKSQAGPAELLFEHSAWMTKQFSLFGDLFQEAIKSGLHAIQTQHPGFYYQQAANHTMTRKRHCKTLCQYSEPSNPDPLQDNGYIEFYGQRPWRPGCQANEAPDPVLEQSGVLSLQARELKVEHYWIIIPLLSSAVAQFREYKSGRMKLYLMAQMGEEYFEAKEYTKSLALLNRVAPFYRSERWWKLLSSVLTTALRCAYITASVQDYITISLELMGKYCFKSNEEKTKIQMNLLRVAKNNAPEAEPACAEESIINAKQLWSEKLNADEKAVYTIEMENLASFIECRASLDRDSFHLDELSCILVYLRSVSVFPMHFNELGLRFSNSMYDEHCMKTEQNEEERGKDLYLEPCKVNIQKFQFILSPADLHKKLEIKQLYLKLGDCILLRWKGGGLDANISPSYDSFNYGGERLPIKKLSDGNIAWDTITISPFTDVLPRSAKIDLTIKHDQPVLVDEFYTFNIFIENMENVKISNTRLTVKEKDASTESAASLFLDKCDGGDGMSPLANIQFDLQQIEGSASVMKVVYLKVHEMGKRTFSFEISYTMRVAVGDTNSMVDCVCSKEEIVEVNVQIPFSVSVKLANLKFQQINDVHADKPFTVITYIKCISPWPIDVSASELLLGTHFKKIEDNFPSQVTELELKETDIASECHCLVSPVDRKSSLNKEYSLMRTVPIGQYSITWKRRSSNHEVKTKVNLPNASLHHMPLFVEAELPPYGCVQNCMQGHYTLYNRTNTVLEVEVLVKASDVFMLSGNSQAQFRILPYGKQKVSYNLYPLVCGEIPLPQVHINLPQFQTLDCKELVQKMLPTHIFVKPIASCKRVKKKEIQVI